jgi:hypothetical protein
VVSYFRAEIRKIEERTFQGQGWKVVILREEKALM